jgi:uncharacterized protein DUF6941
MNVSSIMLSQFATFFEGHRLMIFGSFNQIASPQFPFVMGLCVSIVVEAHPDQHGTTHEWELRIVDASRDVLVTQSEPFEFTVPAPGPAMPVKFTHIIALPLQVPKAGPYAFEYFIDGIYYTATTLYIGEAG